MAAINHPDYKREKERLEFTLKYVYKNLEAFISRKGRIDEAVAKGKKHFNSESSQQYIDLMINTMLQNRAEVKLRNLTQAKSKPYFACVEFKEVDRSNKEKYYIGKMALIDEDIAKVEENYIPREDFKLNEVTIYKYEELNELFLKEYSRLPIVKRLDELKKHMNNRLKAR